VVQELFLQVIYYEHRGTWYTGQIDNEKNSNFLERFHGEVAMVPGSYYLVVLVPIAPFCGTVTWYQ